MLILLHVRIYYPYGIPLTLSQFVHRQVDAQHSVGALGVA
jgi:hypothetical protein